MIEYFAEFLGTMILILLGNGVVANVLLKNTKGENSGWIVITAGWGMAVFIAVLVVGPISVAHINPAVTLGLAFAGLFEWIKVAPFIISQMLGAMAGGALVYAFYRYHFLATDDPDSKMVQEAKTAKERGCFLVAIGPSTQNGLKNLADVYFDNLSPEGYGLFEIDGYDNEIALLGSVINNVINNMFTIQMVYEMNRRGWYPKYWSSYIWVKTPGYHEWANWVIDRVGY